MDNLLVSMLSKVWGRNIIYSVLGLLVAAIASLAWFSAKMVSEVSDVREAAKQEVLAAERRCAAEIDSIRREQIAEVKASLERQRKIEQYLEIVKNKRK
jgi:membrane protein required for beta-lactamase induction